MFEATSLPGQHIICVLGMHRSGTSLITRTLNLLGMYLGPPEHLMKPSPFNPKGFWEHQAIVDLDDEILRRLGGSWRDPPQFFSDWERSGGLADIRRQACALIQEDFGATACWGWKDPRTCLTLPFWKPLLPPLRYVICLRNPADVALSLAHTMPVEKAMDLWHWYTEAALEHTAGEPRVLLFYEDFMADWEAELGRLYRFVANREGQVPQSITQAVRDAMAEELQHHRTSPEAVVDEARLTFPAKALYLALRLSVGLGAGSRPDSRDRPLPPALNAFARYSFEARQDLPRLQSQVAQLQQQVATGQERFEQQQLLLAEQTARAAEFASQLQATAREAECLREELAARDALVGRLEAAITALADKETRLLAALESGQRLTRGGKQGASASASPAGAIADTTGSGRRQYQEMIERVRQLVAIAVPANATIAVVSKGDPELLQLAGRGGWHFPQLPDGTYSGFHPKDSAAALEELKRIRAKGAEFLLFPASALWWFEHYQDFTRHVGGSYHLVTRDDQTCVIYALGRNSAGKRLPPPERTHQYGYLLQR
jgi:hypothetical protein